MTIDYLSPHSSHAMILLLRILCCAGLLCLIIALTTPDPRPRATLFGKWEWVSTQFNGEKTVSPATEGEKTTLVYKPDSTLDQYRNGVLVSRNRPFSVRRTAHPAGKGEVQWMICPDENGFTEPYQTVWLKGAQSDTLLFVGLDPNNRFEPLVYSVFRKVKE